MKAGKKRINRMRSRILENKDNKEFVKNLDKQYSGIEELLANIKIKAFASLLIKGDSKK